MSLLHSWIENNSDDDDDDDDDDDNNNNNSIYWEILTIDQLSNEFETQISTMCLFIETACQEIKQVVPV